MRNRKTRHGRPAEIVRLDTHSWGGDLIDRIKAKTSEKEKGIMMLLCIKDIFNISWEDIGSYKNKEIEEIIQPKTKMFENLSKDRLATARQPLRKWRL